MYVTCNFLRPNEMPGAMNLKMSVPLFEGKEESGRIAALQSIWLVAIGCMIEFSWAMPPFAARLAP